MILTQNETYSAVGKKQKKNKKRPAQQTSQTQYLMVIRVVLHHCAAASGLNLGNKGANKKQLFVLIVSALILCQRT